jgi:hypothetical protein
MAAIMFFLRNSLSDQRLLIKALALVCCIRLGLWLLPFRLLKDKVEKIAARVNSVSPHPQDFRMVRKVASCVRRVSRYVPASTCLAQALATQVLLARRGQNTKLRIGVIKSCDGELRAHAWLESDGKIIIGRVRDLRNYTVLNRLEEVSQ